MIRNLIKNIVSDFLFENIQQAEKIYFKSGLLDSDDKDLILSITNGDNYTKIISDIHYYMKENASWMYNENKDLKKYYENLKNYNRNLIPIKNYNNPNDFKLNIFELIESLSKRASIIKKLKEYFPSIALRNLRNEIRMERTSMELGRYKDNVEYATGLLSMLNNREPEIRNKIYRKIFKSGNSIEDIIEFLEEKENLVGGVDFKPEDIIKMANDNYDMELLYNHNNVIVVRVESPEAIKRIGCNSLWCFTYGNPFNGMNRLWDDYSTNDIVYVIINFNEEPNTNEHMMVLIKPLEFDVQYYDDGYDSPLFGLHNEPFYNPLGELESLFDIKTIKKLFTFDW